MDSKVVGGLRQAKRRETRERIVAAAMGLFIADGFEATSLEAVAEAAGISRRTFFNYFKSKDEILISLQTGLGDALAEAVRTADPGLRPFDAVVAAFQQTLAQYPTDQMIAIDRMMRTNAAVQATKQASYARHEQKLFKALQARWPSPDREMALHLLAIAAIGALRLAADAWASAGEKRAMSDLLEETFAALKAEI